MTVETKKSVLVLGGTRFIGRHSVLALLSAGHAVTVFNRGWSADDLPAGVERLRGDRDHGIAGMQALLGRRWDACVDVSGYTPRQVRPTAELLKDHVSQYIYISSGSVYGEQQVRPVLETHDRLPPAAEDVTVINGDTYGPLKVACENIVQDLFPGRYSILRPQIVVGPHDTQRRYSYWVQRAQLGGPMLAPGDGSDFLQVIDVRDVARFIATSVDRGTTGAFNLAGPRITWARFIAILGVDQPVWIPVERLLAAGVTGPELPLFRTDCPSTSMMDVSSQKAQQAGFTLTDPATTFADTAAFLRDRPFTPNLTPAREASLIQG